jgi:hypothetical protein
MLEALESGFAKIVVVFERRADGGLRVYSDDVPGFVLSHPDAGAVQRDVVPALEGIISEIAGKPVRVSFLSGLRESPEKLLELRGELERREYVTFLAA